MSSGWRDSKMVRWGTFSLPQQTTDQVSTRHVMLIHWGLTESQVGWWKKSLDYFTIVKGIKNLLSLSAQQVSWITAANYGTCKTCGWRGLTSPTRLYASSVSRCLYCPVWTWATATTLMTSQSTCWQQLGPRQGTLSQKSTCQVTN